jgi:acetyltransferase-like isoleucine patch superfamily enzyme
MKIWISKMRNFFALLDANHLRACRIRSLEVSPKALKFSREIEVMGGSSVDASSKIGSYTYIGRNTHITKSDIGRYSSIGNNVSIGQGEHSLDQVSTSSRFYASAWDLLTTGKCEVGHDVWVGVDAVILRGVRIGVGAVVAANAVVTKDVPPFAIVGGVPARLIRYRFSKEKQKVILESAWWELDSDKATEEIRKIETRLGSL